MLDRGRLDGDLTGRPEQSVDQVVAGIGQDAAPGELGVEPPRVLGPAVRRQPGLGQRRRDQPSRPDRRPRRADVAPRPGWAEAILVADADLAVPAAGQPDDVGRLLDVGRERLLDEHVTTGLKRIHGRP